MRRVLECFEHLTGVPVLLNTSFNDHGEPIVETPLDAFQCFAATGLDVLVLGENVLVKGGHANFDQATDILFDGEHFHSFRSDYINTGNLHGTGCTFSAAITARLALGEPLLEAIKHAKHYISRAIENSLSIGRGHGPTNHFYFLQSSDFLER